MIDQDKEYWKKQNEIRQKTFWSRYESIYPTSYLLEGKVHKKIEEIYQKISPSMGQHTSGEFHMNEEGHIASYEPFIIMMGAISNITLDESKNLIEKKFSELKEVKTNFEKWERLLKTLYPELQNVVECPHCKEFTPTEKLYCVNCNALIDSVKANVKNVREKENDE